MSGVVATVVGHHGPGLLGAGASPLVMALVWGVAAFVVMIAVIAVVSVLTRRDQSSE